MSEWISALKEIGLTLFGRESSGEMWAVAVVCTVVVFLLYRKLSSGFAGRGEKTFLTLIPGILVMVAVVAAVRIYLGGTLLLQWIAVGVSFLVLVLPLTSKVEKTGYFNAMVPWVVTALVLAVILYLEPIVMETLSRGVEKGSLLEKQKNRANTWDKL